MQSLCLSCCSFEWLSQAAKTKTLLKKTSLDDISEHKTAHDQLQQIDSRKKTFLGYVRPECIRRTAPRHLVQRRTRQTFPQRTSFSLPVSRRPLPSTSKALKAASIQLSHSEDSCAAAFRAGLSPLLPHGLPCYFPAASCTPASLQYVHC